MFEPSKYLTKQKTEVFDFVSNFIFEFEVYLKMLLLFHNNQNFRLFETKQMK